jgi:M6 family metalloprotease-like protein
MRAAQLFQLMAVDPSKALDLVLPEELAGRLRASAPLDDLETAGEWTGTLTEVVADDFAGHRSTTGWILKTPEGLYDIFAPGRPPWRSGMSVKIAGAALRGRIAVRTEYSGPGAGAVQGCYPSGPQNIAVLMLTTPSYTTFPSSFTKASLQEAFFGSPSDTNNTQSLNGFWKEMSYGAASAVGQVFGPFSLSQDYTMATQNTMLAEAVNVADSTVDFSQFPRLALVFPTTVWGGNAAADSTVGCLTISSPSKGTLPASISWLPAFSNSSPNTALYAHELGHALGLNHASTDDYSQIPLGPPDAAGQLAEYGDPFSVMDGGDTYGAPSPGQYGAEQKSILLDWLHPGDYREVSVSGTYTLAPYEQTSGLRALRILRDAATSTWLWVEYRQPIGDIDSTLQNVTGTNVFDGALIRYEDPTLDSPEHSYLLDFNPSSFPNNFVNAALAAGMEWSDPNTPLSLTVNSATTEGLSITVNYDSTCAVLEASASSFSSAAGSGTITVTAPGTCTWTASTAASWITLTGPTSGAGNGSVSFTVAANSGYQRSAVISMARQSLEISQGTGTLIVEPMTSQDSSGSSGLLTFSFYDSAGASDIWVAFVAVDVARSAVAGIGTGVNSGCSLLLSGSEVSFQFMGTTSTENGPSLVLPASGASISNGPCTIFSDGSALVYSGNLLTATLHVSLAMPLPPTVRFLAGAASRNDTSTGWVPVGQWTVPAPAPASQTIAIAALSDTAFGASPFSVAASASSGLPVGLASSTPAVCTVSGSTVTVAGAGSCSITASQAGNANYAAATPVVVNFTVNQAAQTIAFGALSAVTLPVSPFTVSATASSGLAVSFASAAPSVCTVSGASVTVIGAGTCSLAASQAGNANYLAAPNVTQNFGVNILSQTIVFPALDNVTYGTAPFPISATASSGLAVGFASTTAPVCTVSGQTVTVLETGTCSLTATQAGNSSFAAATPAVRAFTVNPAPQTIAFGSLSPVTLPVAPFPVSATASSGLPVSFSAPTPWICTVSGNTVTILATGNCSILASQSGNSNYLPATAVAASVTVLLGSQTITFGALSGVPAATAPFSIGATASSSLPVSFTATNTPVCTVSGSTVTIHAAGTCSITASQAGNSDYAAAPLVVRSFLVTGGAASQTVTFASLSDLTLGSAPFTVRATASSGLRVGFQSTTAAVCLATGDLVTIVSAGACSIATTQAGNATYGPATPVVRSFTVNRPKPSTGFTAAAGSPPATGAEPSSIAVGDFNGDGIPDLATANRNSYNVTVLLGNGSGGFTPAPGSPFAAGTYPLSIAVGDFNGDGIQDLAVANSGSSDMTILLGNGSGGFTPAAASPIAAGALPLFVAVGDFNGDGIPDLATANSGSSSVSVLLGDGSGGFIPALNSPFATGVDPTSVAVGDFNGDGKQDLAVANGAGGVTVLLGDGTGDFTAASGSPFAAGSGPYFIAVADFNGDGKPDLVVPDYGGNTVAVLLGVGSGGFTAAPGSPFSAGAEPTAAAVGDFNGDGVPDLAISDEGGANNVVVLLGNGSGGFTAAPGSPFAAGANAFSIVVGDFNGDGIQDLVLPSQSGNNLTVLLGQAAQSCDLTGDGTVNIADVQLEINEALGRAPAVNDLNGDGVVNLVDVQMVINGALNLGCSVTPMAPLSRTRLAQDPHAPARFPRPSPR